MSRSLMQVLLGQSGDAQPYEARVTYADGSEGYFPLWAESGRQVLELLGELMPEHQGIKRIVVERREEKRQDESRGGSVPGTLPGDLPRPAERR